MPALERLHQGNCCEIKASQDIDFASKEQGVGKMAKQVRHLCPDNELHSLSLISRTHVKVESTLLPASYIINTKKTIRKFKTEKKTGKDLYSESISDCSFVIWVRNDDAGLKGR